jgi:hypothetical protein
MDLLEELKTKGAEFLKAVEAFFGENHESTVSTEHHVDYTVADAEAAGTPPAEDDKPAA